MSGTSWLNLVKSAGSSGGGDKTSDFTRNLKNEAPLRDVYQ